MLNWNYFAQESLEIGFIIYFMILFIADFPKKAEAAGNEEFSPLMFVLLIISPILINLFLLIFITMIEISGTFLINLIFWSIPPLIGFINVQLLNRKIQRVFNSNSDPTKWDYSMVRIRNSIIRAIIISNIIVISILTLFLVDIFVTINDVFLMDTAIFRIGLLYGYLIYIFFLYHVISLHFNQKFNKFKDKSWQIDKKYAKYAVVGNLTYYIVMLVAFSIFYLVSLTQIGWDWLFTSNSRILCFCVTFCLGGVILLLLFKKAKLISEYENSTNDGGHI